MGQARHVTDRSPARSWSERGGVVTGLVVRVALVAAVAIVAVHEGGQILRAQVKAQSAARAAAARAAMLYTLTHNETRATAEAARAAQATESTARVTKIEYSPDGSATVTVTDRAGTFVAQHVSFLKGFTTQRATEHELYSR
jgi:hypothetical protein